MSEPQTTQTNGKEHKKSKKKITTDERLKPEKKKKRKTVEESVDSPVNKKLKVNGTNEKKPDKQEETVDSPVNKKLLKVNGTNEKKLEKQDEKKQSEKKDEKKQSEKKDVTSQEAVELIKQTSQANGKEANGNLPFSAFRVSKESISLLERRNITYMFPIQAKTYDLVYDGYDVIGRAKTGTGKTLAFALPIVERLKKITKDAPKVPKKLPQVLVLLPTRELALQVYNEFKAVGPQFTSVCVYGGAPYFGQENTLFRGCDIVVGTCGRIMDFLERGTLKLTNIRFVVLDEADKMLDMGFSEDVESILQAVRTGDFKMKSLQQDQSKNGTDIIPHKSGDTRTHKEHLQTLLFSATIPEWVTKIASKYLRPNQKKVDLVQNEDNKASSTVEHLCIFCHYVQRPKILKTVIEVHSGTSGQTIVFANTKKEANLLGTQSALISDAQVIHGDVAQQQRESILKGFRDKKFKILIATDVAARGLDIKGVELVVQTEPPRDSETYIHRSGRTGRAGAPGKSILFYSEHHLWTLRQIEQRAGIKFIRAPIPSAEMVFKKTIGTVQESLSKVSNSVRDSFLKVAKEMISEQGAEQPLAAALAIISGHSKMEEAIKEVQEFSNPDGLGPEMEKRGNWGGRMQRGRGGRGRGGRGWGGRRGGSRGRGRGAGSAGRGNVIAGISGGRGRNRVKF